MTIAELSVRRPVLMTMVYLLIAVIAVVFLPRLDIALYPSVEMPVVSVMVSCNDAGPEEVELQVAEVIEDLGRNGYIPSFCTGCYRLGRTGKDFMDLAKPGLIKRKCAPNALSTFEEYLLDYATPKARAAGEDAIARQLASMDDKVRQISERLLARVRSGSRDVYC